MHYILFEEVSSEREKIEQLLTIGKTWTFLFDLFIFVEI